MGVAPVLAALPLLRLRPCLELLYESAYDPHDTAHGSSHNLLSDLPVNHHSSDFIYWR